MITKNWKDMGYQQIITGLHYLEKVNPSSDSDGKGVLMIIQGAQFTFGLNAADYLKKNYQASGSYSDIASQLGDQYSNAQWRKRMWSFLESYDKSFKTVAKKMAKQKRQEKRHQKQDAMLDKFIERYPHLNQLEQEIQSAIIKGGQNFGKQQADKKSPLNEINVRTSTKKMDVFVAQIEVQQPKVLVTSKKNQYRQFSAFVNLQTSNFKFTDNDVIYGNYCKKSHSKKNSHHTPFQVSGKFKELVNLQPFFTQYLSLCKQQYKKFGFK